MHPAQQLAKICIHQSIGRELQVNLHQFIGSDFESNQRAMPFAGTEQGEYVVAISPPQIHGSPR
jgi:hypothetical protein